MPRALESWNPRPSLCYTAGLLCSLKLRPPMECRADHISARALSHLCRDAIFEGCDECARDSCLSESASSAEATLGGSEPSPRCVTAFLRVWNSRNLRAIDQRDPIQTRRPVLDLAWTPCLDARA